jgi:beta-1,4-mannooligosaccharide/beta-1,4-mannosyl-N-acetylglucosamine phosphorylase
MANETVFRRYERNPIITPSLVPGANSIFNSAVMPYKGGYVGVFRIDTQAYESHLHLGWSDDGLDWRIEPKRLRIPWDDPEFSADDGLGYDPRLQRIGGTYYVSWCAEYHGPTIGIAETKDFRKFRRICNAVPPYNRNAVLFPRKIDGKFAMLHRPSDRGHTPFGDIFYATSPDLVHWGRHVFVMGPRGGWQSTKVGAGPAPIELDDCWLLIYHGVRTTCNGFVYYAGGALLDLEKPWKVLYRTKRYMLAPTELYETTGDVPNVVFPCAAVIDKKRNEMALYYGCADTCVGVAFADMDEIVKFIKKNSF